MGKKSLTKSTSKKKTTKKKTTTAKSASAKTDTKKSSGQKTTSKKTTSGKKPSLKSLRKKDFGAWVPETLYAPEKPEEQFEAPPVIETTDEKTARHLRELLDRKFDAGTKGFSGRLGVNCFLSNSLVVAGFFAFFRAGAFF